MKKPKIIYRDSLAGEIPRWLARVLAFVVIGLFIALIGVMSDIIK